MLNSRCDGALPKSQQQVSYFKSGQKTRHNLDVLYNVMLQFKNQSTRKGVYKSCSCCTWAYGCISHRSAVGRFLTDPADLSIRWVYYIYYTTYSTTYYTVYTVYYAVYYTTLCTIQCTMLCTKIRAKQNLHYIYIQVSFGFGLKVCQNLKTRCSNLPYTLWMPFLADFWSMS